MRWRLTLLAAGLFALTFTLATPASASSCVNLLGEPTPVSPSPGTVGTVELCDTTHDGEWDTVRTQTYPVYSDAHVTVAQEERNTPTKTHEHTYANTMVSLGGPLDPLFWANVQADDHDDHGEIDQTIAEGGAHVEGPIGYGLDGFVGAWDVDGDGTPDLFSFVVCDNVVGCATPDEVSQLESEARGIVENPPTLVFYVPGVGWVP